MGEAILDFGLRILDWGRLGAQGAGMPGVECGVCAILLAPGAVWYNSCRTIRPMRTPDYAWCIVCFCFAAGRLAVCCRAAAAGAGADIRPRCGIARPGRCVGAWLVGQPGGTAAHGQDFAAEPPARPFGPVAAAPTRPPPRLLAAVDLQGHITGANRFYAAALRALWLGLPVMDRPPGGPARLADPAGVTYEAFQEALSDLTEGADVPRQPVLLLDEFERLLAPPSPPPTRRELITPLDGDYQLTIPLLGAYIRQQT